MIRKAEINDVVRIQKLVNAFADKGQVLPRSLNSIYENIRDFAVHEQDGELYGCCALHVTWEDLAEIRSLTVVDSSQGQGIGKKLVAYCLEEAEQLKIKKVFLLTYQTKFFEKLGFKITDKATLPHKIWTECVECVKFPDCSEEAMIRNL
ncbi:MAG: N-acetyltransferase [PVC group bacterium]|nr:N-acetyltransferase [PVC group bacterium]